MKWGHLSFFYWVANLLHHFNLRGLLDVTSAMSAFFFYSSQFLAFIPTGAKEGEVIFLWERKAGFPLASLSLSPVGRRHDGTVFALTQPHNAAALTLITEICCPQVTSYLFLLL